VPGASEGFDDAWLSLVAACSVLCCAVSGRVGAAAGSAMVGVLQAEPTSCGSSGRGGRGGAFVVLPCISAVGKQHHSRMPCRSCISNPVGESFVVEASSCPAGALAAGLDPPGCGCGAVWLCVPGPDWAAA
jgi:hypothetical protein